MLLDGAWQNSTAKLFMTLFTGQVLQFVLALFFSFLTSRMIGPEEVGCWSKALFLLNIYAVFTDFGLEIAAFEVITNAPAKEQERFSSILLFRIALSTLPLMAALFWFLYTGNFLLFFLLAAAFCWLDKVSNLFKIALDKKFAQTVALKSELMAFVTSNFLICLLGAFGCNFLLLPIQRILEKFLLFLFLLKQDSLSFDFTESPAYLYCIVKKYAMPCFGGTVAGLFIYDFLPFFLSINIGNYEAGLFAKAFSLACLPMLVTTIFNRITTPMYSKFCLDKVSCKIIFLKSQIIKLLMLLPVIFVLQQTATFWLTLLLGGRWANIVPLYRILSVYALFRAHYDDLGALVNLGLGKPVLLAKNQILHAILVLISLPVLIYFKSVIFACFCSSLSMMLICIRLWYYIFLELEITSSDIIGVFVSLKRRGLSIVFGASV